MTTKRQHTTATIVLFAAAAAAQTLFIGAGCSSSKSGGQIVADDTARYSAQRERDLREAKELFDRARKLELQGNYQAAAGLYSRAVTLREDLGGAWNNYGVCLLKLGEKKVAADAFRKAADLLPSDPTPYENLGHVYWEAGYAEDALKYYTMSLDRNPNWLPSLRGMVRCTRELRVATELTRERVKNAILIETDPRWLELFGQERLRIETQLGVRER